MEWITHLNTDSLSQCLAQQFLGHSEEITQSPMSMITPRSVQPIHEAKFVNDLPYLRVESELYAHVQKPSRTSTLYFLQLHLQNATYRLYTLRETGTR